MPFSFIEIEEQKNRFIIVLFFTLILFYFFVAWLLVIPFKLVFLSKHLHTAGILPNLTESLIALGIATVAGIVHWHFSVDGVVGRALASINAQPVDEKDSFHKIFKNVVEEASIAAGGKRVEPWIIPVSAMNAFALSDFNNRCVVGITEGLLARLNRAQLEAVIGHEFGHILNGDSKMTTVTSSLFSVYTVMMEGIKKIFASGRRMRFSRSRGGGAIVLFLALVYIILAVTKLMSRLLNLFLSRQREYRADAVSVRLTRNPLALAEALHLISRSWRGAYLNSEHLSNIFIINPAYRRLDEKDGFLPDLFSTHPPIKKRIGIVLDMAHTDLKGMIENLKTKSAALQQKVSRAVVEVDEKEDRWFAVDTSGQWQGPFSLAQLGALPWVNSRTWVHKEFDEKIRYACENDDIRGFLRSGRQEQAAKNCPNCSIPLKQVLYEGVPVLHCSGCNGNLIARGKIMRVFTRKQQGFNPEVIKAAQVIKKTARDRKTYSRLRDPIHSVYELNCPECGQKMQRKFFNFDYAVEIDFCPRCDIIWFDKNELEILQLLFEEQDAHHR